MREVTCACSNFLCPTQTNDLKSYMQPGTPHFVISIEDSLAAGGHLYCSYLLKKSVRGMVREQAIGTLVTNTGHSECGIVFVKMLSYVKCILDRMRDWKPQRAFNKSRGHGTIWVPSHKEITDLVVLVCYLDQLGPAETPKINENHLKMDKTDDEKARDYFYPYGDLVTFDEKNGEINVNHSNVPQIWQRSAAGRHDLHYAVNVIVAGLLTEYMIPPSLLQAIIDSERNLLSWSEAIYDQLSARAEYQCEPSPLRRIRRSSALYRILGMLNKTTKTPLNIQHDFPDTPTAEMHFFKDIVPPKKTNKKKKGSKKNARSKA